MKTVALRNRALKLVVPFLTLSLLACGAPSLKQAPVLSPYASMPEAHSNNATASLVRNGQSYLYSFMGLKAGKTYADVSTAAFEYDLDADQWRRLNPVPVPEGRLASSAVSLLGSIYIFGGYTVDANGHEVSTPDVYRYDPADNTYIRLADIPKPVDDSVVFAYAERYIYLVSGWHMDGNVANVQVFDTKEDVWFNATDFPGVPVFGHAGGIVGDSIVIIDGVAVLGTDQGKRRYGLVSQAFLGKINPDDPSDINWISIDNHGGEPLYRSAGTGSTERGLVLFAGGSTTAYNYNGTGYDGTPARPSARVFGYDVDNDLWMGFEDKALPSMDHRALLPAAGAFWTIGGMTNEQKVMGYPDRITAVE